MNFLSSFTAPAAAWALLFSVVLKSVFVLGAACVVSLILRRASAAARHLVWLLAIAGVLGLPLLSALVPPLHLPAATAPPASHPPLVPSAPVLSQTTAPVAATSVPAAPTPPVAAWPLLLIAVWGIVALGALLRLGVGLFVAGRLTRRCAPVADLALLAEMQRLTEKTNGGRRIALRQGPLVAVPMTIGLRHPVVLLPAEAGAWPTDRREAALLHELTHIRRRDWAFHTLAGVACALYWFNPLVWLAAHRLRAESEAACDDAVLLLGTPAADYANHLLEIARRLSGARTAPPQTAVAMARKPQIEGRLRAILHGGGDRHGLTRRRALLALAGFLLALLPVAALRTAAQDRSEAEARAEAYKMTSLSSLRQIGLAVVMYAQAHGGRLPDAARWVDQIDPIWSHGDEKSFRWLMRDQAAPANQPYGYAFNRALSGVNLATLKDPSHTVVVFESTLGRRNAADTGQSVPVPGRHAGGTHYVFADGRARWLADGDAVSFGVASVPSPPVGASSMPFGTASFTGRVVYEDGRPAANIRVGAQIQNEATMRLSEASQGKLMLPSGVSLPLPPGASRPTDEQVRRSSWAEAVTGPDGSYRLSGLTDAPYNIAVLPLDPKALDDKDTWVAAAVEGAVGTEGKTAPVRDLVLTAGGLVSGLVTDAAGKPLAGVFIGSYGPHRPASSAMIISATTSPDGRYRLRVAPGRSRFYLADERWKAQDVTLDVAKGETKTADFQATPQAAARR